jgi:succinoglycan biosynthesis protein ExoV
MRLYYFAGSGGVRNFGDELNHYVWPRLVPGIFSAPPDDTQFVGIGTLLNDHLPPAPRTVVFGSGVGYYGPPRREPTWDIYCVRGPLSAHALELPACAAITDPGIFVPAVFDVAPVQRQSWRFAFMPHWQTEPAAWAPLCDEAGIGFIDPRWEPGRVVAAIRGTEVLLTEAMHGAIVADAFRIPWIPVRTRDTIKRFKWDDWCRAMELEYQPVSLPTIWKAPAEAGAVRRTRRWARLRIIAALLRRTVRKRPTLSRDDVFRNRLERMGEQLDAFRVREGLAAA